MEKMTTNSRNLDLLRSFAVLLVVGFHLAKFFNWQIETLRVTDFGMLGVMLFFVHTTLVLMFSLERQSAGSSASLFVPFMIRRCFRIYPLAILLVTFTFLFHIPSDLQFGRFNMLHQSAGNFLANLLLIQNVTRQKANPGILWSLPLELQMYLVLPALIPVRFAHEVVVGNDRILVVRGRAMVCGGTLCGRAAPERGRHPVACRSAPEIHAFRAVFPSGDSGLQTLAPAQILAGPVLACIPGGLLRGISVAVRKSADRDGMVHLFRDRSGSVLLSGDAGKSVDARDPTNRPIFLRNLFVPLFRDLDRLCGLPKLERRPANRDFWRRARVPLCVALSHSGSALDRDRRQGFAKTHARFLRSWSRRPLCGTRGANLSRLEQVIVRRNQFHGTVFVVQAILGLAFFLIAASTLAQALPNDNGQSSLKAQTAAEINQRLQQANEKLAGTTTESETSDSRIGPDDLLNISVFEAPEMNSTVRVSASGEISLQLLGAVHAAGLTPKELESVLQAHLRRTYMKDPHVGVFVQELQSHSISVVGAVKMPGVFQIRGTKTVIEVLSMAQGLADDAGDTVLIQHGAESTQPGSSNGSQPTAQEKNGAIEEINLKKLLDSADSALNVPVRPGDIVKVPRAGIVYVVGEVQKPGGFVLQNNENISVLQALALAEGPTHTSAISRARIIRTDPASGKRTEIPMNLGRIFSGKAPDTFLQPKDIVFVPNSAAKSILYRGSEAAVQTAAGVAIYKW